MAASNERGVAWPVVQRTRETERRLSGGCALAPYLEHARNALALTAALREVGEPIKLAFAELGLDYALARQAIAIADTIDRLSGEHPQVRSLGPSLVALVNEAERRFAREQRSAELADVISELAGGAPRSVVREKFLPSLRQPRDAAVLVALRGGRIEAARRAFEALDEPGRKRLRLLSHALGRLVDADDACRRSGRGASIAEAVLAALETEEARDA